MSHYQEQQTNQNTEQLFYGLPTAWTLILDYVFDAP